MDLKLKGKTAFITAASKGIGKAVAHALAAEGANLFICSSNEENIKSTAEEIANQYKGSVVWGICDLNKKEEIDYAVASALRDYRSIDILVNNCGGPPSGYFFDIEDDKWDFFYQQILLSAQRLIKHLLPDMIKNEWGRIINITSISVKQPLENLILSNTFRTALTSLAKTLSGQTAKHNVTINNIAPGYTLTARIYELAENKAKISGVTVEDVLAEIVKDIPMQRMASPSEVGALAAFLASEQAAYITGNTIHIDGGYIKNLY